MFLSLTLVMAELFYQPPAFYSPLRMHGCTTKVVTERMHACMRACLLHACMCVYTDMLKVTCGLEWPTACTTKFPHNMSTLLKWHDVKVLRHSLWRRLYCVRSLLIDPLRSFNRCTEITNNSSVYCENDLIEKAVGGG